jgi:hypothetical protein
MSPNDGCGVRKRKRNPRLITKKIRMQKYQYVLVGDEAVIEWVMGKEEWSKCQICRLIN